MSRASVTRAGAGLAALFIVAGVAERSASAQGAWVDDAGSLTSSLNYTFSNAPNLVANPDETFEDEKISSHSVVLGLEYAPIERLAVDLSLPLMMTKYGGDGMPGPRHGEYDDGDFHTTLTDLRMNARYQVLQDIVAFSPHLGFTLPVADYETQGFAAAGRHLKALHLGGSVGKLFDPFAPNLFFQATYEFTLAEKFTDTETEAQAEVTEEIGQNRSDVSLVVGYFFLEGDLRIDAGFNWRVTHGGVNFTDFVDYDDFQTDPRYLYHDALLNEEFMLVGGDVGYNITDRVSVDVTARYFVRGYNTLDGIRLGLGLTFGIL